MTEKEAYMLVLFAAEEYKNFLDDEGEAADELIDAIE